MLVLRRFRPSFRVHLSLVIWLITFRSIYWIFQSTLGGRPPDLRLIIKSKRMREDQSGKPGKEELVSKYFSEEMEHSGQAGLSQPANFAKNKVYRNILGAIGQGTSGMWRLPLRWPVAASLGALICLSLLGYRV